MTKRAVHICLLTIVTLTVGIRFAHGQNTTTGIVVDSATMAALPSVSVQLKNSFRGTTTDNNGNFSIQTDATDTLVFTLVGYARLELPLFNYEAGIIRLTEKYTLLQAITIDENRREDLYEGMFDDRNAQLKPRIPFYFSKARKEKIKVAVLRNENERVQTYVDVVINDPEFKRGLMKKHSLTEQQYYDLLRGFNERHYEVMYYLTRAELISLVNTYFDNQARR